MNAYFYSHVTAPLSQAVRTPRRSPPHRSGHPPLWPGPRPLSPPAARDGTPSRVTTPGRLRSPPTRLGGAGAAAGTAATPPARHISHSNINSNGGSGSGGVSVSGRPADYRDATPTETLRGTSRGGGGPAPTSPSSPPQRAASIPCLVLFSPQGPRPLEGLTTTTTTTTLTNRDATEGGGGGGGGGRHLSTRKGALHNQALRLPSQERALKSGGGSVRTSAHVPEGVRCVYDRDTRSQLLHIAAGTEVDFSACVRLPGFARGAAATTGVPPSAAAHTIFALQVCVAAPVRTAGERHRAGAASDAAVPPYMPPPGSVNVELVVRTGVSTPTATALTTTTTTSMPNHSSSSISNTGTGSYRLRFTNAVSEVQRHAHHTRFPLRCVRTAQWLQLYIDIDSVMQVCQPPPPSARASQRIVRLHQLRIGVAAGGAAGLSGGLYVRRIVAGHGLPLPPSASAMDHVVHPAGRHSITSEVLAAAAAAVTGIESVAEAVRGGWTLPEPLRLPAEAGETLSLFVRTGQEPVLREPPTLPPSHVVAPTEERPVVVHDNTENQTRSVRPSPQQRQQQPQRREPRALAQAPLVTETAQRTPSPLLEEKESMRRASEVRARPGGPQHTPGHPSPSSVGLRTRAGAVAPVRRAPTALEVLMRREEEGRERPHKAVSQPTPPHSGADRSRALPPPPPPPPTPQPNQPLSARSTSAAAAEAFVVREVPPVALQQEQQQQQQLWCTPPQSPSLSVVAKDAVVPWQRRDVQHADLLMQPVHTPLHQPALLPRGEEEMTDYGASAGDGEGGVAEDDALEAESWRDVTRHGRHIDTLPSAATAPPLSEQLQHTFDVSQLSDDETAAAPVVPGWSPESSAISRHADSRFATLPEDVTSTETSLASASASVTSAAEELLAEVQARVTRLHAVLAEKTKHNSGSNAAAAVWKGPPELSRPNTSAAAAVSDLVAVEAEPPAAAEVVVETQPAPERVRVPGVATPLSLLAAVVVHGVEDGEGRRGRRGTGGVAEDASAPAPSPSPSPAPASAEDTRAVLELWSSTEAPLRLPVFPAQATPPPPEDREEKRRDDAYPIHHAAAVTRASAWRPLAADKPTAAANAIGAAMHTPPQPDSTATSWSFQSSSVAVAATTTNTITTSAVDAGRAAPVQPTTTGALPRAEDGHRNTNIRTNIGGDVSYRPPPPLPSPFATSTKAVVWRRPSTTAAAPRGAVDEVRTDGATPLLAVHSGDEGEGGVDATAGVLLPVHRWTSKLSTPLLPAPTTTTMTIAEAVGSDGGRHIPVHGASGAAAHLRRQTAAAPGDAGSGLMATPTAPVAPWSAQRVTNTATTATVTSSVSSFHMWLPHPMPVMTADMDHRRYPSVTNPSSGGSGPQRQSSLTATTTTTTTTTAVRRGAKPPVVQLSAAAGVSGGGRGGGAPPRADTMSMGEEKGEEAMDTSLPTPPPPPPAAVAALAATAAIPPLHPPHPQQYYEGDAAVGSVAAAEAVQRYVYDSVLQCFLDTETNAYVEEVAYRRELAASKIK